MSLFRFPHNFCVATVTDYVARRSIVVPDEDYLERVQALCKKHNVLLICDEVQTVRYDHQVAPIPLRTRTSTLR